MGNGCDGGNVSAVAAQKKKESISVTRVCKVRGRGHSVMYGMLGDLVEHCSRKNLRL